MRFPATFSYTFLRLIKLIMILIPRRIAYRLVDDFMVLGYYFYPRKRKNVRANIAHILRYSGCKETECEFRRRVIYLTKEVFRNFAKQFYDMMRMTKYDYRRISKLFEFEGFENIENALMDGKGCLVVTAHFSTWELVAAMVAQRFKKFSAVFLKHLDPGINRFYLRQRSIHNIGTILLGKNSFSECQKALARNELLVLLADIDYAKNGMEVTILGKKFMVPKGPPLLSIRTDVPIMPGTIVRKKDDTFKIMITKPIDIPAEGPVEERMRKIAETYIKIFEDAILKNPSQWLCFERL